MQTGRISLMQHHVGPFVRDRLGPLPGIRNALRYGINLAISVATYTWMARLERLDRTLSLEDNTTITLVKDGAEEVKIDFRCHGCPYFDLCSIGKSPREAMSARLGSLYALHEEAKKRNAPLREKFKKLFPMGEYKLGELVERVKPHLGY